MVWLTPEWSHELSELLKGSVRDRPPIVFTGAQQPSKTVRPLLEELEVDVVSVATPNLSSVIAYEPRDLVVTVGVGIRLEDLAGTLAEMGQWLPVAESRPNATVGGLVASAVPCALDPTLGSMRRHLLACRIVAHDGRELRWGRPVVKNVAGYNVQGLWCGSRGRLGALTEVSLRVWPLPARDALFEIVSAAHSTELLTAFCGLPAAASFRPDGVSWSWRRGSAEPQVLQLRLFGPAESVAERRVMLERWAMERDAEARETGPSAGRLGTETQTADPLTRVVAYLMVGRPKLAGAARRLVDSLGTRLSALDAYPLDGIVRCEYDRDGGVSLRAVVEAAGQAELLVDRAGPDEHAFASRRRSDRVVDLERRVLGSLGGRERHWIAEHV